MAENPPKRPKRRGRPPKNSTPPKDTTPKNTSSGSSSITLPRETDLEKGAVVNLNGNAKIGYNNGAGTVDFKPENWGLPAITDEVINKQISFDPLQSVNDITKPEGLKTVSQADYDKAVHIYDGAIRYRDLEIKHSKYVAKSFQSLAESFNALAAGLGSKVAYEKAKQKFIDVCKEESITEEKIVQYVNQIHKTGTAKANLPYAIADRENTLEENRLKALKSTEKLKQSQKDAEDFVRSLGAETKPS